MSKNKITIFSSPNCSHCDSAKDYVKKMGYEFRTIDITHDQDALGYLTKKGITGMPVLEINGETIVGFDKKKIVEAIGKEKQKDETQTKNKSSKKDANKGGEKKGRV